MSDTPTPAPNPTPAPAASPAPQREHREGREGRERGGRPIAQSQRPTGGDKAQYGKRQFFRRRKVCKFCVEKIDLIDYKDTRILNQFVSERGKIVPRRISGVCTPCQRRLAEAIKQARNIALLPFAAGAGR